MYNLMFMYCSVKYVYVDRVQHVWRMNLAFVTDNTYLEKYHLFCPECFIDHSSVYNNHVATVFSGLRSSIAITHKAYAGIGRW